MSDMILFCEHIDKKKRNINIVHKNIGNGRSRKMIKIKKQINVSKDRYANNLTNGYFAVAAVYVSSVSGWCGKRRKDRSLTERPIVGQCGLE